MHEEVQLHDPRAFLLLTDLNSDCFRLSISKLVCVRGRHLTGPPFSAPILPILVVWLLLQPPYRAKEREGGEDDGQVPEGPLGEAPRVGRGLAAQVAREDGYKGSAERAFPGEAANQIGNAEGEDERVRHRRGAEQQRYPLIA